jgi:muramidase (phage lysozyme)
MTKQPTSSTDTNIPILKTQIQPAAKRNAQRSMSKPSVHPSQRLLQRRNARKQRVRSERMAAIAVLGSGLCILFQTLGQQTPIEVESTPLLSAFELTTNVQAFLKLIRFSEGTLDADGYQLIYAGEIFTDFSQHPDTVVCAGDYCSSAAGAYQYLPETWERIAREVGAKDFSPVNQDIAAIELLTEAGVIDRLRTQDIRGAIAAAADTWSSLPRFDGDRHGHYNQPVKPMPLLVEKFQEYGGTCQPADLSVASCLARHDDSHQPHQLSSR